MKVVKIALVFLLPVSAFGQEDDIQQRIASPFQAPVNNTPVAPVEAPTANPLDNFEFNGLIQIGGVLQASVYDKENNKSYWLTLNQPGEDGIMITDFNDEDQSIVASRNGFTKRMELPDPNIVTIKAAPRPVQAQATRPATTATPVTRPTNTNDIQDASDEDVRKRMQKVAEEIRRRRALRRSVIDEGSSTNTNR